MILHVIRFLKRERNPVFSQLRIEYEEEGSWDPEESCSRFGDSWIPRVTGLLKDHRFGVQGVLWLRIVLEPEF